MKEELMETKLSAVMMPPFIEATQISVPIFVHRLRVDPVPCMPTDCPVEPLGGPVTTSAFIGSLRELLDVLEQPEAAEVVSGWLAGSAAAPPDEGLLAVNVGWNNAINNCVIHLRDRLAEVGPETARELTVIAAAFERMLRRPDGSSDG